MEKSQKAEQKQCWEFMNCSEGIRNQCPSYTSDAEEPCWITKQVGKIKDSSHISNSCRQCSWFLKKNGKIQYTL